MPGTPRKGLLQGPSLFHSHEAWQGTLATQFQSLCQSGITKSEMPRTLAQGFCSVPCSYDAPNSQSSNKSMTKHPVLLKLMALHLGVDVDVPALHLTPQPFCDRRDICTLLPGVKKSDMASRMLTHFESLSSLLQSEEGDLIKVNVTPRHYCPPTCFLSCSADVTISLLSLMQ